MMMIYKIKLENLNNGDVAYVTARANEKAEVLCPKIKIALDLPFCDTGHHRFISHGITYVIEERVMWEPEMLLEYELRPGPYRSSERITVQNIFTTLGSSILYTQDGLWAHEYKVRCTFVQRISNYEWGRSAQ
jgi:hypothetical protein